jgi:DNA-binding CsgD family transcriptional regulator
MVYGDSALLVGRAAEQAMIAGLLTRSAHGSALLIRGAPGIGKSALVDDTVVRASRSRKVLRAAGTPSETGLELAGLHQLRWPILPWTNSLSELRRTALNVAFSITPGPAPERYVVAMAALDLLAEAAAYTPLLVVAEDIQWMDPATIAVLTFVGRRLESDAIVLIATTRDDVPSPLQDAAIGVMELLPLADSDSRQLLAAIAPELRSTAQRRILAVAAGNPLALTELPRALDRSSGLADGPEWLPLSGRLQAAFADRVKSLPADTRTALTLLALHDSDALAELLAALPAAGVRSDGLAAFGPAVEASLVELSAGAVRFRHPLMRSAVYQLPSPSIRAACHSALAAAVGTETDRGTLHRARAAAGFDPGLADDLEAVAQRAVGRGAVSTAVTALARAAELTPSVPDKQRFLSRAATLAYQLGERDVGDALRARLAPLADDEPSRLRLEELNEAADASTSGGISRIFTLVELAKQARELGDGRLAASLLRSAAYRCWARQPNAAAAHTIAGLLATDPHWLDRAQQAIVLGLADPVGSAKAVTSLLASLSMAELDSETVQSLGHAASCIGDFELADSIYTGVVVRLRIEGRLQVLARALLLQAWARLRRGQWSTAVSLAEEGRRLAEECERLEWQANGYAAQAMVAALRGQAAESESLAARAEQIAVPYQMTNAVATSVLARAVTAAGEGDFPRAWDYLVRMHDEGDPGCHPIQALWALSHLAHAALQCGQVESTRRMVRQLTERLAVASAGPAARMNVLYAQALLAPDDVVDDRLREAIGRDVGIWPFERSRLQFVLGSRLRRQHRVRDCRQYLLAARDGFDNLGAACWADRARDELRAAGVPSPMPVPAIWSELSPQELQIARMVAEGLSNREIGERLYLSHRTVSSHLYRLFPKLGITSRVQLTTLSLDLPSASHSVT